MQVTYSCVTGGSALCARTGTNSYTSTLNGYFNYLSSSNNSTSSSSYGTGSLTATLSPYNNNTGTAGNETFNYWTWRTGSSTGTQIMFWNANNSIVLDINADLNTSTLGYSLATGSIYANISGSEPGGSYFCSSGNNSTTNGANQGIGSTTCTDGTGTGGSTNYIQQITGFSGNTSIAPSPSIAFGILPFLGVGIYRFKRFRSTKTVNRISKSPVCPQLVDPLIIGYK